MSEQTQPLQVKATRHESYWTYSILAVLIPVVSLILGIAYMTKADKLDRKLGEHLVAVSVLFMILFGIAYAVWTNAHATTLYVPTY